MSELIEMEKAADQLKDQGKNEEAIAAYLAILEKDEKFVRAHLALAVVYERAGDFERSVFHGEKACEIEPEDHFNFMALSITYQRAFEGTRDQAFIQKAEDAKARAAMG